MKKHNAKLAIASIIIGLAATLSIYGTKVLNPAHTDWLMHQGDLTQHYIGWLAFRSDAWQFPPGMMKNVIYPAGTSVVFMDSIPLMAIFFKILNPVLPAAFQYFGIYCVITYSAQAFFAAKLMRRLSANTAVIALGVVFFVFSPILMQRMFFHTALSSHFLILAGILLLLRRQNNRRTMIYWAALNTLTIMIHFYLTAIVFILFAAHCAYIYTTQKDRRYIAKTLALSMCAMLAAAYLAGYFVGSSGASQQGFGMFSLNLNALINPMTYSAFFKNLPTATIGQHESFMYLGLGGIIGVLLAAFAVVQHPRRYIERQNSSQRAFAKIIAAVIVLTTIYAVSNVITLNDKILLHIPLSGAMLSLCNIFRASARFFWIPYYLLTYAIFACLLKSCDADYKKIAIAALLVFLQICDLGAPIAAKRKEFASSFVYENILTSDIWDDIAGSMSHVMIAGDEIVEKQYAHIIERLIPHGLTVNNAYLARDISADTKAYTKQKLDALRHGDIDRDTVIIMDSNTYAANLSDKYNTCDIFFANGMYIAAPCGALSGEYADCRKISSGSGSAPQHQTPKIVAGAANKANSDLYKAYDGDSSTFWCGNSNQEAEDIIKFELDGHYNINGIIMEYPTASGSAAQSLSVCHSSDGVNWQVCNIRAVSQNRRYTFDSVYCKYLMLKLDKPSDTPWYISELILTQSN